MKYKIKTKLCEISLDVNEVINNKTINESLESSDKTYIKDEIGKFVDTNKFEKKVKDVITDGLKKGGFIEKEIVEIVKNCIVQAYKSIWLKKGSWVSGIKNNK